MRGNCYQTKKSFLINTWAFTDIRRCCLGKQSWTSWTQGNTIGRVRIKETLKHVVIQEKMTWAVTAGHLKNQMSSWQIKRFVQSPWSQVQYLSDKLKLTLHKCVLWYLIQRVISFDDREILFYFCFHSKHL